MQRLISQNKQKAMLDFKTLHARLAFIVPKFYQIFLLLYIFVNFFALDIRRLTLNE